MCAERVTDCKIHIQSRAWNRPTAEIAANTVITTCCAQESWNLSTKSAGRTSISREQALRGRLRLVSENDFSQKILESCNQEEESCNTSFPLLYHVSLLICLLISVVTPFVVRARCRLRRRQWPDPCPPDVIWRCGGADCLVPPNVFVQTCR